MGARYYEPQLGRFTRPDPSGRRRMPTSTRAATPSATPVPPDWHPLPEKSPW
ncbi:RHS repeat-associated core domain-containing protein [Streptomyces hirsutus]|uniref:hypothetical protein n=1 Tax=Streptomyces hirsutus TaxID=35620 RepID=UPI0036619DD3